MKYYKIFIFSVIIPLFIFTTVSIVHPFVYAANDPCSALGGTLGSNGVCNFSLNPPIPTNCSTINSTISTIIDVLFAVAGLLFFVMIVVSGIEWLMSGGEEEKKRNAQSRLINAVIGIAIVAGSFFIFEIILNLFGVGGASVFSNPIVKTSGTCQLQ